MKRCTDGRTDPKLWERAKKKAKREACKAGKRRCGTWDARMAQRAGKIYRDEDGGYCGTRTRSQRSMSKWTKEDWRTATGEKACRKVKGRTVCDRYLPAKAWKELTPTEKAATRQKKLMSRDQYVSNTSAAKRAGRRARMGGLGAITPMQRNLAIGGVALVLLYLASRTQKGKAVTEKVVETSKQAVEKVVETSKQAVEKVVETSKQAVEAGRRLVFGAGDPTEKNIATLAAQMQPVVRQFVEQARAAGYRTVIASGRRTMDEQSKLYAQGRSAPGKIITQAQPGDSAHNFGLAVDFAFGNAIGQPMWPENAPWGAVAAIGKRLGLEWGGEWKTFKDRPHLELPTWKLARAEFKKTGQLTT